MQEPQSVLLPLRSVSHISSTAMSRMTSFIILRGIFLAMCFEVCAHLSSVWRVTGRTVAWNGDLPVMTGVEPG